ncbi:hypothetical protein Q0Z83_018130 [Actinoplanes sichuanensis]|nr:hypothetical protein Q0Z83_018130 [Actinoplanes sichuanensis]
MSRRAASQEPPEVACELLPLSPLETTGESVAAEELEDDDDDDDVDEADVVDDESAACAARPIPAVAARPATTRAPVTSVARRRPMSRCM